MKIYLFGLSALTSVSAYKNSSPHVNLFVEQDSSLQDSRIRAQAQRELRHDLAELQAAELAEEERAAGFLGKENALLEQAAHHSFLGKGYTVGEEVGQLASEAQRQAANLKFVASAMLAYQNRLRPGGDPYANLRAITALQTLSSEPNAILAMNLNFPMLMTLKKIMSDESTPDEVRHAAGSLITRITHLPVASSNSDDTGGYGHINIVMPNPSVYEADSDILELRSGSAPADTEIGDYYG